MRSFFSPFSLELGQFRECEAFTLSATVFSQSTKKVLLLTINSLDLVKSIGWLDTRNVKFSTVLRNKKPVLAIEPADNKSDGRIMVGKSFISIRSVGAPFLPKETHKQKNLVAYVDEVLGEKIITVTLPSDYNIVNDNFVSDQPDVVNWPDTNFDEQHTTHYRRSGVRHAHR